MEHDQHAPAHETRRWEPAGFRLQTSTVWSFPERGSWATHDGSYRGNWSPYIPRNLILRYSRPGDLVLDPFVGGGTTAIEAKLLDRRCVATDITAAALARTRGKTQFGEARALPSPALARADARMLPLRENSVDLICAHPPYANIVRYSAGQPGDLSHLATEPFLKELGQVASECFRVAKPGSVCAVLMGDTRKQGNVIPLGLRTLEVFQEAGFVPKEIVLKEQHNTRMEGIWAHRFEVRNLLLLAHEYLFILRKP